MSAVLVLAHGQAVSAERVQVRAYPVRLRAGGTAIACDERTARALAHAVLALLDGTDSRYDLPGALPLPDDVDGFVPRGPVELPPPGPPLVRDFGDPSYRTDDPRRRP